MEKQVKKTECITQLYQIGVYAILNGKSELQFNWSPNILVKIEKHLKKQAESGEISDLVFGREIVVVINDDGCFEEIK